MLNPQPRKNFVAPYLALLLTQAIVHATPTTEAILTKLPGQTRIEKLEGLSSSLNDLEDFRSLLERHVGDTPQEADETEEEFGEEREARSVIQEAIADLELMIRS